MNKLVIVVRGGVVQAVRSSEPIEYVIVDWDDIEAGDDELPSYVTDTTRRLCDIAEMPNEQELFIIDQLKSIGFE